MSEQNGKDWFADQYEKVIGKPLHRKELTADEVLKRLKDSAKYRWISEAKSYKTPVPPTGNVYHLEWRDPQVMKCMCPDRDCTCRGGVMLPRRKIPRGEKYYKSPLARKLMQSFRKPVPPPSRNFIQRLADVVGVEASIYKDLQRNDVLSIRGAEFCTSRCIRYYGAGNFPNFKHIQDKQKLSNKNNKVPLPHNMQDTDKEDRICDGYSCTVSTQTMIGPDGQFVFGNYSHVLFGTIGETVVRDIEGTELHISPYKCVRDHSRDATNNPCNLDKLLSWRDLINMREFKNHLSSIKRNIYSSIFELKETNVPEGNLTTQCEEECVSKKSSEKISIATPYKGVMIKVKKDPRDIPTNQIQEEVPQMQNSSNIMPNITVPTKSEGLDMHLKETSSLPTEIKQYMSLHKEIIRRSSQIDSAERKIINHSLINQEQNQSIKQNEKSSKNYTDLLVKHEKSSYEQITTQSQKLPIPADGRSDLKINDVKDTISHREKDDENNQMDPLNIKDNQSNSQNLLQTRVVSINSQKIATLSQHSQHIHENIDNREASKQHLSKNRLFKIIKHFEDPGNEISKCNIRNFIKKRLYGLSFEQLQKIKIKKYSKSFSYPFDSDKISNNEIKPNNDVINASKLDIKQDISNFQFNDKIICDNIPQFESQQNSDLTNVNTTKFLSETLNTNQYKSRSRDLTSVKDLEKLKQPNISEACMLDKDTAVSINNVCKIEKTSEDKIPTGSIYKSHGDFKDQYCGNDSECSKLPQLENKNTSISVHESKESPLHNNDPDINRNIAKISLCLGNQTTKEGSEKSTSVIKKISNISIQLRKLICKKLDHSIKSSPERTLHNDYRKSNNTRINMSEIDYTNCAKSGEKESNEDPKTSEKEVFSIQYSALLS